MSGFRRDKSRRVDSDGYQGSPMSGFGRENRAVWSPCEFPEESWKLIKILGIPGNPGMPPGAPQKSTRGAVDRIPVHRDAVHTPPRC